MAESVVNMDELIKNLDDESPFVMLNLLKFKSKEGHEAYKRYLANAQHKVEAVGGRAIYLGQPKELLQGEETWDFIMLVEYPSRKAFLQMIREEAYQEIHKDRALGMERAVLYVTEPLKFSDVFGDSK